jgi:hypothetical protein
MEKELFDLVDSVGEGLHLSLHIIDISEECEDGTKYRVYHSHGYCFNVERESIDDLENFIAEYGNINVGNYYYNFQSDLFDGFKTLSLETATLLISNYK